MKLCPPEEAQQFDQSALGPSSTIFSISKLGCLPYIYCRLVFVSVRLAYCESGFMIDSLLKGVEFKRVYFKFVLDGVYLYLGDIMIIGCLKCILRPFSRGNPKCG